MQSEIGFFSLISEATFIVQLVLLVLIVASVLSWSAIIVKWREFRRIKMQAARFEERFWSGMELSELYKEINEQEQEGMAKIFYSGFNEYIRLHKQDSLSPLAIADTAVRSMKVVLAREVDNWNKHLNFLSVVASTSPYVGLFGTVWGIMHAFLALQDVQQATLSLVAPGIAEALVATALGLFAAIPAVIAYNRFSEHSNLLISRYDNFIEEFTAILHRQILHKNNS
ncbi:MAG: protein TolQ [Chromatiales bacterium]|nr:protein TolQ [Chromatiales bacterium]